MINVSHTVGIHVWKNFLKIALQTLNKHALIFHCACGMDGCSSIKICNTTYTQNNFSKNL
jgi:hypothetical protein